MADKWLTFDCYGTIADWNGGMGGALEAIAGADSGRLLAAYHREELELEAGPGWMPYREVLTSGLASAARHEGLTLAHGDEQAFVRAWPDMPVFEDAGPALTALREQGWRLAILTNCDDDLFATTRSAAAGAVRSGDHGPAGRQLQAGPGAFPRLRRPDDGQQGQLDSRGQQLGA